MSPSGDYGDEMDDITEGLSEDVAAFFRTTKAASLRAPEPAVERAHIAAIVEAVHLLEPARTGQPATTRRKIMSALWFKIAAAVVAAVLGTGGLAAADVLPDPVQDVVATAAQTVGVDLPSSKDKVKVKKVKKVKTGLDHNEDGVPDDNGNHYGEDKNETDDNAKVKVKKPKDGLDHDGDKVPDDNGNHYGQTKEKDGLDHNEDGVKDDNGNHYGQTKDKNKSPDDSK